MPHQVPVQVARERNQILRELAAQKKLAFMQSLIGRPVQAITLNRTQSRPDGHFTEALTDNFLKLLLPGRYAANHWVRAHPEQVVGEVLVSRAC
jgi:tRNA A37 methylthiotransferase MiaB